MQEDHFSNWYCASQAAEVLSRNSNKNIRPYYLHKLAKTGAIEAIKVGKRRNLYSKEDIDNYIVEARGVKANRKRRLMQVINLQRCGVSFLRKAPKGK